MSKTITSYVHRALASKLFLRLAIMWFAVQASWIALSGRFPMAFDENYHLGIIRLYSARLSPIWTHHPPGSESFGAVSRDPSFLYHYLFGFIHRLIEPFVKTEMAQVLIFRFINIAIFITGIVVFKKVLKLAGCSDKMSNVVLAMFAATPLVPLLAGQLNYDNALFLESALALLFTLKVTSDIQANKISSKNVLLLLLVCLTGSITKYAFLPVVLAIGGVIIWTAAKQSSLTWLQIWKQFTKGFAAFTPVKKVFYSILILLFLLLGFERYGINTIRYKTPTPECNQVLSIEKCMQYSPWRRNYLTEQSKNNGTLKPADTRPLNYVYKIWLTSITYQLFFTIDGAKNNYVLGPAFKLVRKISVAIMYIGLICFIFKFRAIRKKYRFGILLMPAAIYTFVLLLQNYADFIHIGYPYAIQGRYLIPFLPVLYAVIAVSIFTALGNYRDFKAWVAVIAMTVIVTQGGGAGTYILRSDSDWYWDNYTIQRANGNAKKVIQPFVIGD